MMRLQTNNQNLVHATITVTRHVAENSNREVLLQILSDDEQKQYKHFRFQSDRDIYLVAHYELRNLLSSLTGIEPSAWRFTQKHGGRPSIDTPKQFRSLYFSLSHTSGCTACAVSMCCAVGIDVEHMADMDFMKIAQKTFSKRARLELDNLIGINKKIRFFELWTSNEAFYKATGQSLEKPQQYSDQFSWPKCQLQLMGVLPDYKLAIATLSKYPMKYLIRFKNSAIMQTTLKGEE